MTSDPLSWRRGSRASFTLGADPGVYALFLRSGANLPGVDPAEQGLLYIGKADGHGGFKRRCHFKGGTRNHSPRKSLAVLLMQELSLVPVLIRKPTAPNTWALERHSEERLSKWMHSNLDLAIELRTDPRVVERELVAKLAPPLNLNLCKQSVGHRKIAAARGTVLASLELST
ncbi:MAG TPA: hypothetical protein VEF55_03965 [Candidatus Binatia bacterium]|nr:hypothetical protein [Candidatus Binatia bacterium]